ncbi:S-phase kinase-associated protein 2 [Arctopsyche grandis]|uniref:S-phase kinase-associated protein 2 n=1 Tax=Arctopsyche grandis TaxID=121162 RepID=UPI00406D8D44
MDRESTSSRTWSLMEENKNEKISEDMGVSLLRNNSVESLNSKDNIENCSPNAQRGIKRSHSRSSFSADVLLGLQDNEPPSKYGLTNHLLNCGSSNDEINVDETSSIGERKRFQVDCVGQNVITTCQSSNCNISECKDPSQESQGDAHGSPLTTCGPHPPFHKYSKSIARHTTFDDDNIKHEKNDVMNVLKLSDGSENKNNDNQSTLAINTIETVLDDFDVKKNRDEEVEIVGDTVEVENLDHVAPTPEKECFVANNLSFCESCSGASDSLPDTCASISCQDNENAFSKLFDEDVLSIFQWLPKKTLVRCMLVCKRWYRLSLNSRLWSRVCLCGVLPSGVIPNLMSRHPIVLRLANAQIVAPVIPCNITPPSVWRVQYLDLSAASVTPSCLAKILNLCPSLLRLSLEGLSMSEAASVALGHLKQLKVLNLALATGLGIEGAKSISSLASLEALNVAWTGLDSEAMDVLCNGLSSTIQRLNLSGFRKTLTERLVAVVVSRCPNLVELDLSDCVMMGEGLMPILRSVRKLEHLAISRCNRLSMADIAQLNHFSSLLCVDVFGLVTTPYNLSGLQTILPKIQLNQYVHSAIARPTVGNRRTSIWGLRTRD